MSKLLSKLSHIHMIRILFKPISQHSGLSNKKYTMSPGDANKNLPRPSFVSRNLVAIVMIPAIIGMHYGWVLLQGNKSLVSEKEKIDLPVITAAKYLWRKISPVENDTTTK